MVQGTNEEALQREKGVRQGRGEGREGVESGCL